MKVFQQTLLYANNLFTTQVCSASCLLHWEAEGLDEEILIQIFALGF